MADLDVLTAQVRETQGVLDAVRLLTTAAVHGGGPAAIAERFIDEYPRAFAAPALRKALAAGDLVEKAVAPAMTTTAEYAGHLLPPAWLDPLLNQMQAASVLARLPVQKAPINVPIPFESAPPSLAWIGQGKPKPTTNLTLSTLTLGSFKFSGILVQSRELAEATDAASTALLSRRLIAASTRFLDQQLLDRTVVGGLDHPASLLASVTPTAPGTTIEETLSAVQSAFWTARPHATRPTYLCSPQVVGVIAATGKQPRLEVSGGFLNGYPVVVTPGAADQVILADAAGIYAFDGGGTVSPSQYAAIEMEAAPTAPATAATVLVSLWTTNLIGLRLERWCSWAKEPDTVQYAILA